MSALSSAQRTRGRRSPPSDGGVQADARGRWPPGTPRVRPGGARGRAGGLLVGQPAERLLDEGGRPRPRWRPAGGTPPTRSAGRWAVAQRDRHVNVLPRPRVLSARTEPPCSRTSSCTRARPMPVPSCVRPRAPSTRWNRSKMPRQLLGRDARPGVADGQLHRAADGPQADGDLPLEGELEGVGEQVQDDLLPHVAVHVDRLGQRRAVHHQPQPGLLAGRAEVAGELRGQRRQVGRLERRPDPARLDP